MSDYCSLFSQTFYGLLFSYLTMTDVTSQPKKLVKLTKSLLYHKCFYLQNFTEKNNSCTPCVPMFTIVYTFTAKSQFEKKSKLNDICPQPSWAYGHSSKIKSRSLWVVAHWEQRQSLKNTIAEMPPGHELYS